MTLVELPFAGGIDEALRHELVDPTASFVTAENVRQRNRGGLGKRFAFSALTNTGVHAAFNISAGLKLFADHDSIVAVGSLSSSGLPFLRSYDAESDRWFPIYSEPAHCTVSLRDIPSVGTAAYLQDVAYANGYLAITWTSFTGATADTYAAVISETSGAMVSPPTQVGTITTATVGYLVSVGDRFILVRGDSGTAAIKAWYLDTTSAATIFTGWVAITDLAADLGTPFRYAVATLGGDRAALVYTNDSGGTNQATVVTFDSTGDLETATIPTASVLPDAVDCAGVSTGTLWVSWNQTTAVRLRGYDPDDLTSVVATTTTVITAATGVALIGIAPYETTTSSGRIIVNDTNATMRSHVNSFSTSGGAVVAGGATTVFAALAASRPFCRGDYAYVPVYAADASNLQNQITIVGFNYDIPSFQPMACAAPGLATIDLTGKRTTVKVSARYYTPLSIKRSGAAEGSALVVTDFTSSRRYQAARIGNSTYLSGGVLMYTDGFRCSEAGFLYRPPKVTQTNGSTGISGTFRCVAVYEEVDADGNWHQSGVSTPSDSVTVSNKTITWSTAPLSVSNRFTSDVQASTVRVAWYRTLTGGEAPYYRLGTTALDLTAGTVTFADAVTDVTLAGNAKLYSQPGVPGVAQDRRPPPGLGIIAEYNGMLVGAADADLWYSGQPITGEGTWFNPVFVVPFPEPITGLASQDGVLVVFTRRAVYAVSGGPPSDNGTTGLLGTPQRLSADVGCIEPRSVCVTALGTFFQSERGIEMLTRARTVEWIGEAVQATLASYPVVTAATFDGDSSCVLIEIAAGESSGVVTGNGRTLVYDVSLKKWQSVDRRANSAGTADSPAQSGAMVYTGSAYRYAWLGSDGRVYVENQASYVDPNSTWVTMRVETGWFKLAGLQSQQMLHTMLLMARYATDHNLNVSAAYDYSTTYKSANTYTRASLATLNASWPSQQIEHPLHVDAEGQSMRLKIEDATPTGGTVGTGQGATWVALTVHGTPKEGAALLPSIAR